jgi:transcriptional regulator with XRE-family HTH domain
MNINDKIKQILIDKNLTPSYFADEIGVQRSSISHILSGRNRPSFDIIQKIIRRFPELGYEWIMEEELYNTSSSVSTGYAGRTIRPSVERPEQAAINSSTTFARPYSGPPSTGIRSQRDEIAPVSLAMPNAVDPMPIESKPATSGTDKKVERILIFYTDGSFREYTPTN